MTKARSHPLCKAGCGKPAKRWGNDRFALTCGDHYCVFKLMQNAGKKRAMERAEIAANRIVNPSEPESAMHFEDATVEEWFVVRHDHPTRSPGTASSANL
jgi:hypothetical protein